MLILTRILVGDQERILMNSRGRFVTILEPGEHWVWTLGRDIRTETHEIRKLVFTSEWSDYLVRERAELVARLFTLVETGDSQVAIIRLDGKVAGVLEPARRVLYWRGPVEVSAETIDVKAAPEVPQRLAMALARLGTEARVTWAQVEEGKTALLFVENRFVRALEPGMHAFWNAASPRVEVVDLRLQAMEVAGQEILTSDKVAIRVNLWATYQVVDAVKARQSLKDATDHLYKTLQLAVRQTLGKRTLEQILEEKTAIDESVAGEVRREMEQYGVRVGSIALKDIVLPGEVRDILNQVVTAEKQAQANLIRRREETAATRSLLNTARLMEGNPLLVRLKELETLEAVAAKVDKITIHEGFDGLLQKLVSLRGENS